MNTYIPELILHLCAAGHTCTWTHNATQLQQGELCFYLSYGEIVSEQVLNKFKHNLVVHGSDLPKGKGWSPLTWQVLAGDTRHPLTLIEADLKVDSGIIYDQCWFEFDGSELIDEMRRVQGKKSILLCIRFVDNYPEILKSARAQYGEESFYPRRRPQDSKLDISQPLASQFNLLRVVDNQSYPAFFKYKNQKYVLSISKAENKK